MHSLKLAMLALNVVTRQAEADECLYVLNSASESIVVIAPASNAVAGNIVVGNALRPYAIAISPNGDRIYLGNRGSNNIAIVDSASLRVLSRIDVPDPFQIVVSPDGHYLGVVSINENRLSVFSTRFNQLKFRFDIRARGLAFSADSRRLYTVGDGNDGFQHIMIIDTVTGASRQSLRVDGDQLLLLSPDGSNLLSAGTQYLKIIGVAQEVTVGQVAWGPDSVTGLAVTPDGTRAYVSFLERNGVLIVDLMAKRVIGSIPFRQPEHLLLRPHSDQLYVAALDSEMDVSQTYVINTEMNTVERAIPEFWVDAALSPDEKRIYLVNGAGLRVFDGDSGTLIAETRSTFPSRLVGAKDKLYVGTGIGLFQIDQTAGRIGERVAIDRGTRGLVITPDGTELYAALVTPDGRAVADIAKIETDTNHVSFTAPVEQPWRLAVDPARHRLYVIAFDHVCRGRTGASVRSTSGIEYRRRSKRA